jgi:hypothetical protein
MEIKMVDKKASKEEQSKHVKTFRAGQVSGAIFSRVKEINKQKVTFYNVKIAKSYKKEGDDEWSSTDNYNREDLIKVLIVANKCAEYIYLKEMDSEDEE